MGEVTRSFRDWEEYPICKCALTVTMPDGGMMSFFGEAKTVAAARKVASFKADFAINERMLNDVTGDDEDSSGTEEDECLEEEENRRLVPDGEEDDHDRNDDTPRETGTEEDGYLAEEENHRRIPDEDEDGHDREDDKRQHTNKGRLDEKSRKVADDTAIMEIVDSDGDSDVQLVRSTHQPPLQSKPTDRDQADSDSDDGSDEEIPLQMLQGRLQVGKNQSSRERVRIYTRDGDQDEPKWETSALASTVRRPQHDNLPQRNGQDADRAAGAVKFPCNFDDRDPSVWPQQKSNSDIPPSLLTKRKECIIEPKSNGLSRRTEELEDRESHVFDKGSCDVSNHEKESELNDLSHLQTGDSVDEPAFRDFESQLQKTAPREVGSEAELLSREAKGRVDSATDVGLKREVSSPASRDLDNDSASGLIAFHEAKQIHDTQAEWEGECENSEPSFREADTQLAEPASRRDVSESDHDELVFRDSTAKSLSPLVFKSASEEPADPEARFGSDSPSPPEVEEVQIRTARNDVDKYPETGSYSSASGDSGECTADDPRNSRGRPTPSRKTKNADSSNKMYPPGCYEPPVWIQHQNKPPLRKYRQRSIQAPGAKRRRLLNTQRRSGPLRQDHVMQISKSGTRLGGDEGNHLLPHNIASNGPSPSSYHGKKDQVEDEWNVVPQIKGSSGNGTVVPIPRVRRGKPNDGKDRSKPNGEMCDILATDSVTNGDDAESRVRGDLKRSGLGRSNERNRNSVKRGTEARPISSGIRHDADARGKTHMMPGLPGTQGMNGMVRNHNMNGIAGGSSMNGISGAPWFPTQGVLAQAHQLNQHGLVPPLQAPNMFLPVVAHNPYFLGAQPHTHPGMYGYGVAEQTEMHRRAVGDAWLDHQFARTRKHRTEKRVRYKDSGADRSSDSPPNESDAVPIRDKTSPETVEPPSESRAFDASDKTSPETPNSVVEPGECSSGDDEDGEDHVSTLHVMALKMRRCTNPDFKFAKKGGSGRWECTVKVKLLPAKPGDRLLMRTVSGRNRKKAKQKASKRLILALKEKLSVSKDQDSSENDSPTAGEIAVLDKMTGISTAIGVLNQLWHWKKLDTQPDARFEEIEGGKWRCTFLLTLPDVGTVTVSEVGPQKKLAKNMAGFKAVERLRELKVLRPEEFAHVKPVKILREDEEGCGKDLDEVRIAKEEIVQISDDEDGDVQVEEEDKSEGRFFLPKRYSVVVASSPQECEAWREANAKPGSEIGIYVDSWSARRSFAEPEVLPLTVRHNVKDALKQPVMCFSSKMSALVVRRDKCQDDRSRELDCVKGFWLPEAVRLLLRDESVRKHGYNIDDGLMSLQQLHDICVSALDDISISSLAFGTLNSTEGTRVLWGIRELMRQWLKKEVESANLKDVWANETGVVDVLRKGADETVGTAILSAFACTCIQEQMRHAGVRRRSQLYGPAAELQELSKRLMHNPFRRE